jgi:hypothetical protein
MNNLKPLFAALEKIVFGAIEIELPNGEIQRFSSDNTRVTNPVLHRSIT